MRATQRTNDQTNEQSTDPPDGQASGPDAQTESILGADKPPPPPPPPVVSDPPPSALRTYMMLRLGMAAVILGLFVSVGYDRARFGCWQPSISAYYYTPVRAVFIGALITLGFSMVVLWGKHWVEDCLLNLAGLLAPIVAFVPTSDPKACPEVVQGPGSSQLADKLAGKVPTPNTAKTPTDVLVNTTHNAITNNVAMYGCVVAVCLAALVVLAFIPGKRLVPTPSAAGKRWVREPGFWVPWVTAVALWIYLAMNFLSDRDSFDAHMHGFAANTLFGFMAAVIGCNAITELIDSRRDSRNDDDRHRSRIYARWYALLFVVMISGTVILKFVLANALGLHTLFAEAWGIGFFAMFWVIQTADRTVQGAPRSHAEVVA